MPTFRMLPPTSVAQQIRTVNGRTYSGAPGQAVDIVDFDAEVLTANGWTKVSLSGPTTSRPSPTLGATPPYLAVPGLDFLDTTLIQIAAAVATNAATSTSSPTLSFASVPAVVTEGMSVNDVTSGNLIGTVESTTSTTVTLAANAAHAVASGDVLTFSASGVLVIFDGVTWRTGTGVAV
jgi:hypothetical protein